MGILECASRASVWKGFDCYAQEKVLRLDEIGEDLFRAEVSGSEDNVYEVELNIRHPRKSNCNCPRANGKRVVCKHIVATYFLVCPEEGDRLIAETMAARGGEMQRQEELYRKVCRKIQSMSQTELQETLLALLEYGPEWQYERFIREHGLDEEG